MTPRAEAACWVQGTGGWAGFRAARSSPIATGGQCCLRREQRRLVSSGEAQGQGSPVLLAVFSVRRVAGLLRRRPELSAETAGWLGTLRARESLGHKSKGRPAGTFMWTAKLGFSVEINFFIEFLLHLSLFTTIQHNISRQWGKDFIYMKIGW